MGAFVEHQFEKGFILDEERLRKLHSLISDRLKSYDSSFQLSYKVYRGDSYCYETDKIDDVLAEENEDWRKLNKLNLFCEQFVFSLIFESKGVTIKIESSDRDKVFILFSDIRSYIESEILIKRIISTEKVYARFILFIVFLFLAMLTYSLFTLNIKYEFDSEAKKVLNSTDLSTKLNYLISKPYSAVKQTNSSFNILSITFLLMLLFVVLLFLKKYVERIISYFFPFNLFLFGKQKIFYDKRKETLNKILWGIIITFFVSVVAGIASKVF